MFSTDKEQKLDWMYKTPNSMVDREEYLLGRSVDKTLEQLNEEEKRKQSGIVLPQPKNHVEHECIPPSIREYNQQVDEQVDLPTKLKEDPLVLIRKREEETRRQFLQNPVQLKKLQKALKAQEMKKKKKKKKDSDEDLDRKIREKLEMLKGGAKVDKEKKKGKAKSSSLDTVLMHKFNLLKDQLSEHDMQNILDGKISDSDSSDYTDSERKRKKRGNDYKRKSRKERSSSSESSEDEKIRAKAKNYKSNRKSGSKYSRERSDSINKERRNKHHPEKQRSPSPPERHQRNRSPSERHQRNRSPTKINVPEKITAYKRHNNRRHSDDSEGSREEKKFGLVRADGKQIPLKGKHSKEHEIVKRRDPEPDAKAKLPEKKKQRLTEEEKEKLRLEMMENAKWRETERAKKVKYYREKDAKEAANQEFNPDFMRKELLKSANSSTVESRVKANINKIQRSSNDMNAHFSRRN